MTLPITLPSGYIIVYGELEQSPSGITMDNSKWRYGSVYQIWSGGEAYIYGGDQVMFDKNEVTVRIAESGSEYHNYVMLPARLVTKQNPLS